jgi:toxin YoeB
MSLPRKRVLTRPKACHTRKLEPLKHELAGCWSRRIDRQHRLVYEVKEEKIRILACRNHY